MKNFEKLDIDRKFWEGMNYIQTRLNLNDQTISTQTDLKWQKYTFCKLNQLSLPFYNLEKLAGFLSISVDKLARGEVIGTFDSKMIEAEVKKSLHDEYQIGAGSKSFTLRHLLILAKSKGVYHNTINHFRLPAHLVEAKVDFEIPVQLVADVMDYISQLSPMSYSDFEYVASKNAFYFQDGAFGKVMKSAANAGEVYERLVFLTRYLEENWNYKITKLNSKQLTIESFSTEKISDLYKKRDFACYNFTRFRGAFAGSLTGYLGLNNAKSQVTRSVHNGDSFDQLLITFDDIKQPLSQPFYLQ